MGYTKSFDVDKLHPDHTHLKLQHVSYCQCFFDVLHCLQVGVVFTGVLLQQMISPSSANYLVINIGNVHHIDDVIVKVANQNAAKDVKCNI